MARWNAGSPHRKRGLAITPVKFGISFTLSHLNQAGALVLIYQDGTVQVSHGGTEMGQGVHTNIRAIAARELGVAPGQVRVMPTSTDKVPNTSATAASVGTDINGAATQNACEILRGRLAAVALALFGPESRLERLRFADGHVFDCDQPGTRIAFGELARQAWTRRVSLSATGFYATPGVHWDWGTVSGRPFHYFACGAAVGGGGSGWIHGDAPALAGGHSARCGRRDQRRNQPRASGGRFRARVGLADDGGAEMDKDGRLLTHSPDTYKIPAIGDMPEEFHVNFLKNSAPKQTILGHKAVGEPPLMLAISVREALRDAVAAFMRRAVPFCSRRLPRRRRFGWRRRNIRDNPGHSCCDRPPATVNSERAHLYREHHSKLCGGAPGRRPLQAARQQLTKDWWDLRRSTHELYTSQVVLDEIANGETRMAEQRLELMAHIDLLELTDEARALTKEILISGLLPAAADRDAAHIALATAHEMDILLSWNCRHIANATIQARLRLLVEKSNFTLPSFARRTN